MTTGREVTVSGEMSIEIPRNPSSVLEGATAAAKALKDVVMRKPKPVIINGEQYLENEDWQTVGQFYGYTTKTRDAVPVEVEGVKGAKAYADLVDFRSGLIIGGAEAYCMRDEERWASRPWYQLASMAQTRASSKALKNRLSWVVVLAGYKTTPAEEVSAEVVKPTGHFCKVHNTPFFKKGKMKDWAHPIGDSGEWCNESVKPDAPQEKAARDPASIKNFGELYTACKKDFNLMPAEVWKELGVTCQEDLKSLPSECYQTILTARKPPVKTPTNEEPPVGE